MTAPHFGRSGDDGGSGRARQDASQDVLDARGCHMESGDCFPLCLVFTVAG